MIGHPKHKPHDPKCSCVTGQYECWHCRKPLLDAIARRMTPAQHAYDRLAMAGWRSDDDDGSVADCCSCHINPPCGYCLTHCADCGEHEDECGCDHRATAPEAPTAGDEA